MQACFSESLFKYVSEPLCTYFITTLSRIKQWFLKLSIQNFARFDYSSSEEEEEEADEDAEEPAEVQGREEEEQGDDEEELEEEGTEGEDIVTEEEGRNF